MNSYTKQRGTLLEERLSARFLKISAAAFAWFVALTAAINVWVDPYRIWGVPWGFADNLPRPRATQQVALLKSRGIERLHPVTVILGNSRAEIGFDPKSAQWPEALRPVYNAAIAGTGISNALSLLSQSISSGQLRHALVGLEFLDFLTDVTEDPVSTTTSFSGGKGGLLGRLSSDAKLALSLDTLLDSAQTLALYRDPYSPNITPSGFNPLREYLLDVRREGYGSLFRQKDESNARAYSRAPKSVFAGASRSSESWRELDQLVTLARAHAVDVKFIIYPYHAHILEMFQQVGLMPAFATWKRHLVEVLATGGGVDDRKCTLWDFSGYNRYTTEPVPPPEDRNAEVRWYWESGHFKSDLGDLMLTRIYDEGDPAFGTCLTRANVELMNDHLREGHDGFVKTHPASREAITKMLGASAQ